MKDTFELIVNPQLKDLNPIFFGHISTTQGYHRPRGLRNHTLIFYVEKGYAEFFREDKRYEVGEGNIIIIPSGIITQLDVEEEKLWEAVYIGFSGNLSLAFKNLPAVMEYPPEIFEELYSIRDFEGRKDTRAASWLMKLYSEIIPEKKESPRDYVLRVKEYIDSNYPMPISVSNIAKEMNMNQSYLTREFKKKIGKSIQEYLISTRLSHAKQMLLAGEKNITEAALSCGFNSPSHFTKMFKKYYNIAPKRDRDLGKNNQIT